MTITLRRTLLLALLPTLALAQDGDGAKLGKPTEAEADAPMTAPAKADDAEQTKAKLAPEPSAGAKLAEPDNSMVAPVADKSAPKKKKQKPSNETLHLWGQLQVWTTVIDQDEDPQADPGSYNDPEADPGFNVQRGRFGMYGTTATTGKQKVLYSLSAGIASPYDALSVADQDFQVVDAFGAWETESGAGTTRVSFGLVKIPFSREGLMSSQDLLFEERHAGTEWIAPIRDTGVLVTHTLPFSDEEDGARLIANAGVYNGSPWFTGDTDPGLRYNGRVEFALGDTYKSWSADGDAAFGIGGSFMHNSALASKTTGFAGDLLARVSVVTLMGEFLYSDQKPGDSTTINPDVLTATKRMAWMGQASVFAKTKGTSGLDIGAKISSFDDAIALKDNGDVMRLHAGLTYRDILSRMDLGAGYIMRMETQGRSIKNDTVRIWTQFRPDIKLR